MVEDATPADARELLAQAPVASERRALPPLSNDERAFWRRAVLLERRRIDRDETVATLQSHN